MERLTPSGFGPGTDLIVRFHVPTLGVLGRLVRLGPALQAMLKPHAYPPAVAAIMIDSTVLAASLAGGLKYDGIFSLQISSNGPIGMLVADVTSEGAFRGYARVDEESRSALEALGADASVPRVLGGGHMAFTLDQGPDTERYQGITDLEGATMADCAQNYFRRSEQLDTAVRMANRVPTDTGDAAGGAMILQRVSREGGSDGVAGTGGANEDAEEAWRRAVIFMSSLTNDELLDATLAPEQVLYRLFHQEDLRVEPRRPLRHACRCSRQRVAMTLRSFPESEIETFKVESVVSVTCEFCKSIYTFDDGELSALYAS